jgi:3-dehydroquinate synthase
MQDVHVSVPGHEHLYQVHVGDGVLEHAVSYFDFSRYSKRIVVTDDRVAQAWLPALRQAIPAIDAAVVLPFGEQEKSIANVQRIWSSMRDAECDRKSLVLLLGGGVVGDIGGFAASTYMRGVDFIQVPTTLVAQVDSSIGGKTGFNFDNLKNLIGTFVQPVCVLADTRTLATLPDREFVAGFAEMFKHGLIQDGEYFSRLAAKQPRTFGADELPELVAASVRIKTGVIERDEREAGERKLLNFGHTVGHAVEALSWHSDHSLLHGEAVAVGMSIETELSMQNGLISSDEVQWIRHVLSTAGLPVRIPYLSVDGLVEKMRIDKKNEHGVMLFTLLERLGQGTYNQKVDEEILREIIKRNMEPQGAN